MKCGDSDDVHFDRLDDALHELGMLSTITDARRDFLKSNNTSVGVMRMNTRYVSNVTIGFCMKKSANKPRMQPYNIPLRHRTKSENSDTFLNVDIADIVSSGDKICDTLLVPSCSYVSFVDAIDLKKSRPIKDIKKSQLKKSHSLEDVTAEVENASYNLHPHELDYVSRKIKKIQFDE